MNRPHIICHMMTTLDGKITFGTINKKDTGIWLFKDYMDLYNQTHEKLGTSWMCGRVTMDEFDEEEKYSLDNFKNIEVEQGDFVVKSELNNYSVGIDTKGLLRWKENFLYIGSEKIDSNKFNLVMIISKETPQEFLAYLRSKNISYIFGGDREIDFEEIFVKLKNLFGIETLLLEGGGSINGSIIDEDLIDEISLLLIPLVVNNVEAPSLFYKQLVASKIHNFKLTNAERLDKDVMWMRYISMK